MFPPPRRRVLLSGLPQARHDLWRTGVKNVYLDGRFVSNKQTLGDYDVYWNPYVPGVGLEPVPARLHPEHMDMSEQKMPNALTSRERECQNGSKLSKP